MYFFPHLHPPSTSVPVSLLHPSPAYPAPSSSSLSLLLFLLCSAFPGPFYLVCSRASGKAPGYICRLLKLDPASSQITLDPLLGLPAPTCNSCLLGTCFALNNELVRPFSWWLQIPKFFCQDKQTPPWKHLTLSCITGAKAV